MHMRRTYIMWGLLGLILLGVLIVLRGSPLSKQHRQARTPNDVIATMKLNLNLTEEQVRQITPIIEDHVQQRNAMMEQAKRQGFTQEAIQTQVRALRQSTNSKLSQYLTQDQLKKMESDRPSFPAQKK